MCVIVFKPQNVVLPESTIDLCFEENPHGAGYTLIRNKDNFFTRKGFMSLQDLKTDLNRNGDLTPCGLVLHFRIMTSGIVNPANTHPYPITNKPELFTQTEFTNKSVIYHNGVLFGVKQSWTDDINQYSDSCLLARDVLSHTDKTGILNVLSLIANTSNNKFCLVDSHGNAYMFGTFTKQDGVFYSNMYWKTTKVKYTYDYDGYNVAWWGGYKSKQDKPKTDNKSTYTGTKCKRCGTFLFNWERHNDGLCSECVRDLVYKSEHILSSEHKNPDKPKNTTSTLAVHNTIFCQNCGAKLNDSEFQYCEDCLESYTNPHNPQD